MNSFTDGAAVRKNESFQFGAPANVGTFVAKSLESDRAAAANDSTPSLENDRPTFQFGAPASGNRLFSSKHIFNQTKQDEPSNIVEKMLDKNAISSIICDGRTLKTDNNMVSSSRVKFQVETHPLRWDTMKNKPRFEAHHHPLRLIHTKHLYPFTNGRYICDIDNKLHEQPAFVFNCPTCEFDICLDCVAKPCLNCTNRHCDHTQIKITLL